MSRPADPPGADTATPHRRNLLLVGLAGAAALGWYGLPRLRALGLPLLVSTSRKSFLGVAVGSPESPRPVEQRGAATLASELWTAWQGVEYIRTHDVRCLCDGLRILAHLQPGSHSPC